MLINPECEVLLRQHDKSCSMRKLRVICTHCMLHRMFWYTWCYNHWIARHCISVCNMFSCLNIIAILNCSCKIMSDIFNRGTLNHISHNIMFIAYIPFQWMEKCIKSLICSEFRWNCFHKLRVNNCILCKHPRHSTNTNLFISIRIRNYSDSINLWACSCWCSNCNPWKHLIRRCHLSTWWTISIIPQIIWWLWNEHCHILSRVHNWTAT